MDDTETAADDARYEALAAELAEDNDPWGGDDSGSDGGAPAYDAEPREEMRGRPGRDDPDDDGGDGEEFDRVEQAALQADQLEYQMRQQYAQQRERQAPSLYDDPIGHLQGMANELQQMRAHREHQAFMGQVEQAENVFAEMTPDYHEGVEFLEGSRRNELKHMYPDDSPHVHMMARQHGCRTPAELREKIFMHDAQTVARSAMQRGVNPAKAYYDLAVARGYKTKAAPPARGGRGASRGGGRGTSVDKLVGLYTSDPDAFDKEWDRMAGAGRLG